MEINIFNDPNDVPQPKDKIKIERVEATPYPDGFRVHVEIDVTPFRERPNLLIVMLDEAGNNINELSVIETMHTKMEFTDDQYTSCHIFWKSHEFLDTISSSSINQLTK